MIFFEHFITFWHSRCSRLTLFLFCPLVHNVTWLTGDWWVLCVKLMTKEFWYLHSWPEATNAIRLRGRCFIKWLSLTLTWSKYTVLSCLVTVYAHLMSNIPVLLCRWRIRRTPAHSHLVSQWLSDVLEGHEPFSWCWIAERIFQGSLDRKAFV